MSLRLILLTGLLVLPLWADANQAASKQSELDALKSRLQGLQQAFRASQSQREEAVDALRESELAVSHGVRALRALDAQQQQIEHALADINRQIDTLSTRVTQQQAALGRALRSGPLRGQQDALRVLLSGADPNQTARDLRYFSMLSRAQHAQIEVLRQDIARLATLRDEAEAQAQAQASLRAARSQEHAKLLADRRVRAQTLQQLSTQIQKQRREIETLRRDERALTQLVERLNRVMAEQAARAAQRARQAQRAPQDVPSQNRKPVAVNTETPEAFRSNQPFSSLKGRLRLPVAGELMNRFGAPREEGGVSWRGLFIRTASGTSVKAIAAGQVVFADWLRGFGNLIILDHGEGYMSLYSNNESLYKQVGERVQPGDAIASVGNSGGQPDNGLYFEMRHQSRPLNPMLWVK